MKAIVYSKPNCGYCVRVKALLKSKGVEVTETLITDENLHESLTALTTANQGATVVVKQVPQVIIDDTYIGGYKQVCEFYGINV